MMTFSEMTHTYIVYPFLIGSHPYSKDQGYFWCSSHHHTSLLYQSYHCRRKLHLPYPLWWYIPTLFTHSKLAVIRTARVKVIFGVPATVTSLPFINPTIATESSISPTLCDDTYLHCLPILNWQSSVQQGSRLFLVFQPPSQVSPLSILPLPQKDPSPLPSVMIHTYIVYPFLIGSHPYSKGQGYFWCSSHRHKSPLYQSYHCRRKLHLPYPLQQSRKKNCMIPKEDLHWLA